MQGRNNNMYLNFKHLYLNDLSEITLITEIIDTRNIQSYSTLYDLNASFLKFNKLLKLPKYFM